MKYIKDTVSGLYGGICIAIGVTAFLVCSRDSSLLGLFVGAFLMSSALFMICFFGFGLYTGKVGYILEKKPMYVLTVLETWIGNFLTVALVGSLIRNSLPSVIERAVSISSERLSRPWYAALFLSIMCGILIYVAVECWNKNEGAAKLTGIFLGVTIFMICGFDHSIANMFYLAVAGLLFTPNAMLYVFIWTIGNAIGSLLYALWKKLNKD